MDTCLGFKPYILHVTKNMRTYPHHREQMNGQIEKRKEKDKKRRCQTFDTMHLLGGRGSALIP